MALNETEWRLLDGPGLKRIVSGVALCADDVAGALNGESTARASGPTLGFFGHQGRRENDVKTFDQTGEISGARWVIRPAGECAEVWFWPPLSCSFPALTTMVH